MSVAKLEPAFSSGEVSPDLYGRFDLARLGVAVTTGRNAYVRFTGGLSSRGGSAFVGFSKQTGRTVPPRLIPFQFSINQGLALEFGDQYMRVIQNGAFVTESPIAISGITQADPAHVSSSGAGITAATPINSGVMVSYVHGELVTLAGGTFITQAVLEVTTTQLDSLIGNAAGSGYVPANIIILAGGTSSVSASVTINKTKVSALPTIAAAGTGGTPGPATVTGTTGTGTKFQATVTISGGGIITSVNSLTVAGSYSVNPTSISNEPVTGGSLVGAQLSIVMGVDTFAILSAGIFSVNAPSGNFTQASTTGVGTGATFQQGVFGPHAVTVSNPGVYTVVPSNPVAQDSTTGSGLGATFNLTSSSIAVFNDGDWVFMDGVVGMTEVNGETYVIDNSSSTGFDLLDVYGNNIDSTGFSAYVSGGTVARIYTADSPYAEADLQFLKFTQSKDVMSMCCVNQDTLTEYEPEDLTRFGNTDWRFIPMRPGTDVDPPTNVSGVASSGGTTYYQYVVTSINPDDGTESIASDVATIALAVDIAATAGRITITWTPVAGVSQYNVYKATPAYNTDPPVGSQFGFAGYAFGAEFIDSNITADFSQVPPLAQNPFAEGAIQSVSAGVAGAGYTNAALVITTSTGTDAIFEAIIVGGGVVAWLKRSGGENYRDTDTAAVTGDGTGATAILDVGPITGTYPATVSYFQERRVYAYSLNFPDTFWMSQPGAFKNFDSRIPTIDSDSITGSPWSVQVDGVQSMVSMPGGLVVLTGRDAWQLTGTGGSSLNPQPITPSTQQAQPQAFNGCNDHIPPIKIDYDILYVQAKGSIVRDLSYQFYTNIYTGSDLTLNSSHLFSQQFASSAGVLVEWAWTEEPYKVLWIVRGDGIMLALTFVKPQEVAGWTRHDTNGFFKSLCSVTEPPVDALYVATQRFPGTHTAYMIERMDNRVWDSGQTAWCVDCGLSLDQPTPNATLTVSSATGLGAVSGYSGLLSGTGWSVNTTITVVDDNGAGPGTGCVITPTIDSDGTISDLTISVAGTGYVNPKAVATDPAGSAGGTEFSATLTLSNAATFTASASVFAMGDVGKVIRAAGGIATITHYTNGTTVTGEITAPLTNTIPNSGGRVAPQEADFWTMTTPVSTIGGLKYLTGATITGTADGVEIESQVVPASGEIDLPQASTSVIVGLGFTVQMQTVYVDGGEPTIQAQRKKIAAASIRVEASHGFTVGTSQPDGSTFSPQQIAPEWSDMKDASLFYKSPPPFGSAVSPLYTGDVRIPLPGGFGTKGQIAIEQTRPFPINLLAVICELDEGDDTEVKPKETQRGNARQ